MSNKITNSAVRIRSSTAEDVVAIQSIYAHYVLTSTVTFEEVPPTVPEMEQRRAIILERGFPYIIAALSDGTIVGYAYANFHKERSAYRFTAEDTIYIHKDWSRQGIGAKLLIELLNRLKACGIHQVVAIIAVPQQQGSRAAVEGTRATGAENIGDTVSILSNGSNALHAKFGFTRAAYYTKIGFKFDQWIDVIGLQLSLREWNPSLVYKQLDTIRHQERKGGCDADAGALGAGTRTSVKGALHSPAECCVEGFADPLQELIKRSHLCGLCTEDGSRLKSADWFMQVATNGARTGYAPSLRTVGLFGISNEGLLFVAQRGAGGSRGGAGDEGDQMSALILSGTAPLFEQWRFEGTIKKQKSVMNVAPKSLLAYMLACADERASAPAVHRTAALRRLDLDEGKVTEEELQLAGIAAYRLHVTWCELMAGGPATRPGGPAKTVWHREGPDYPWVNKRVLPFNNGAENLQSVLGSESSPAVAVTAATSTLQDTSASASSFASASTTAADAVATAADAVATAAAAAAAVAAAAAAATAAAAAASLREEVVCEEEEEEEAVVSEETLRSFQMNGACVLRGLLSHAQVEALTADIEHHRAHPGPNASIASRAEDPGCFFEDFCNWDRPDLLTYRTLATEGLLPRAAAKLMQSPSVRLYHDHLLVKEAHTAQPTPWHQDQPYYNITGTQNISFWIPIDPVPLGSTLQFVKGSHADGMWYLPKTFLSEEYKWFKSGDEEGGKPMREIPSHLSSPVKPLVLSCKTEGKKEEDTTSSSTSASGSGEIIGWAVQPGDVVAFHMLTLHASSGSDDLRRALSLRYMGHDIRHAPRAWRTSPEFGEALKSELRAGLPMRHRFFPLVYGKVEMEEDTEEESGKEEATTFTATKS